MDIKKFYYTKEDVARRARDLFRSMARLRIAANHSNKTEISSLSSDYEHELHYLLSEVIAYHDKMITRLESLDEVVIKSEVFFNKHESLVEDYIRSRCEEEKE